ncbi:MAG: hypothetical protein AB4206_13010 [Xenococcaceae cyanobacterium]
MTQNTYQLPLTFEQILALVRQLPREEQIKLTREINQNTVEQPIDYRTETFRNLMKQVEPIAEDFDPQQAKEDYLKEKYKRT